MRLFGFRILRLHLWSNHHDMLLCINLLKVQVLNVLQYLKQIFHTNATLKIWSAIQWIKSEYMMSTLTKLIDICFVKPRSSKCSFFKGMLTCYGCPEILGNVHYLGQGVKKFQKIFRGGNFFSLKKNRESFFFSKFLWGGPLIFMKFSVLLAAPCHK